SKVAVEFPQTGKHEFTVDAIYKQPYLGQWVTSLAAYEANYPDQFDFQIYVKTRGGETAENTRALKAVGKQYPGPDLETRSQYKASTASDINQLLHPRDLWLFLA